MLLDYLLAALIIAAPTASAALSLAVLVYVAAKVRERREKHDNARYPVLYAMRRIARIAWLKNGYLRHEDLRPLFEEGVLIIDPYYFDTPQELLHWLYSLLDRKGRRVCPLQPMPARPQAALVAQPV